MIRYSQLEAEESAKKIYRLPVDRLRKHPGNYRNHPPKNVFNLGQSYLLYGQVKPIVVWQEAPEATDYLIVAGHGFYLGATSVGAMVLEAVVLAPGTDPVIIEGYLAADNQGGFEDDLLKYAVILRKQQAASQPVAALGLSDKEVAAIMRIAARTPQPQADPQQGAERPQALKAPSRVRSGEIWQLGRHKLGCLDSYSPALSQLFPVHKMPDIIHADPLYGQNLLEAPGSLGKSKQYQPVRGDNMDFDPAIFIPLAAIQIFWGANHYANRLPNSPFWIAWDKQAGAKDTTFATMELAWCNDPQPARVISHVWDGFRRDSEQGIERYHPNQSR